MGRRMTADHTDLIARLPVPCPFCNEPMQHRGRGWVFEAISDVWLCPICKTRAETFIRATYRRNGSETAT